MADCVRVAATIERKAETLPRYVEVPAVSMAGWTLNGTTVVEAWLNGVSLGRRSLKPWDEARWFMEIPQAACSKVGVDTGDAVTLEVWPASRELPAELADLISESRVAQANWAALSAARQRMLREEIMGAKSEETRRRRARRALLPGPGPARRRRTRR